MKKKLLTRDKKCLPSPNRFILLNKKSPSESPHEHLRPQTQIPKPAASAGAKTVRAWRYRQSGDAMRLRYFHSIGHRPRACPYARAAIHAAAAVVFPAHGAERDGRHAGARVRAEIGARRLSQ